jgi:hypothetical protein
MKIFLRKVSKLGPVTKKKCEIVYTFITDIIHTVNSTDISRGDTP